MGLPQNNNSLEAIIASLKDQKDWVKETNNLIMLIEALGDLGKSTSARELAKLLRKSKSWVGVGILLARGLKTYPEIVKCRNRNEAYLFLQKKNRMRRFLES